MEETRSLLGRVVTWTVIGILAVIALRIVFRLIGFAMGIAGFLLFTLGPILLVGWILVKAWQAFSKEPVM